MNRNILSSTVWLAVVVTIGILGSMGVSRAYAQPASTVVGFDGGSDDGFTGNAFFEASDGNPGGNAHFFLETFGIEIRTGQEDGPMNPNFLGDYSAASSVVFGLDVQVDSITFFGSEVSRNLGVVLVDRDIQGPSGPSGLWYTLGSISAASTSDWTHLDVTIDDVTQGALPLGWIGFGDEDPNTFETILPPGASFASVLAGVDEFRISTFEPGFFFGFTNFDARLDNVSVQVNTVPEPVGLAFFAAALGCLTHRRRRT